MNIDESTKGLFAAQLLVYKARNQEDLTPVWNCARQHGNEKCYLIYRELALRLANPDAPGYQKLCEPFVMGEDADGFLTENGERTVRKDEVEKMNMGAANPCFGLLPDAINHCRSILKTRLQDGTLDENAIDEILDVLQ